MRKTKYFIMAFIFLLFLNSCGYLEYAYEQAVLAYGGNPYKDPKPKKDAPNAIGNPKYKQQIELLLQDISNRELTEKFYYFEDNEKETILWLPEGIIHGQGKNLLKDRKTGKQTIVYIEAISFREAKQIAMRDFPNYRVQ